MFLNRIFLDPRCKEARRDLSDPYQLHSTLCRAFSTPNIKCPKGEFLWRIEPETHSSGCAQILVQSRKKPDWMGIGIKGWLAKADPAIDLNERLKLNLLKGGQQFRFRLRANPCVTRKGKRLGLLRTEEQEQWIMRKGECQGFALPRLAAFDLSKSEQKRVDVRISQEQILRGNQHTGNAIRIFSALYDGILIVTQPDQFRNALEIGIGHGKALGLGLLSVVPIA